MCVYNKDQLYIKNVSNRLVWLEPDSYINVLETENSFEGVDNNIFDSKVKRLCWLKGHFIYEDKNVYIFSECTDDSPIFLSFEQYHITYQLLPPEFPMIVDKTACPNIVNHYPFSIISKQVHDILDVLCKQDVKYGNDTINDTVFQNIGMAHELMSGNEISDYMINLDNKHNIFLFG